jgi:chemotaxis protein CheD
MTDHTITPSSTSEERRKVTDHEEYFNAQFPEKPLYVGFMESVLSDNVKEMLVTTTGTGIAVCINDKELKAGGLAHLVVPDHIKGQNDTLKQQYKNALSSIITPLIDSGSTTERLKVKLFGGSDIGRSSSDEGQKTYTLIISILSDMGLEVGIEEIGSQVGRRIHFFPKNGKVVRRFLQRQPDRDMLIERENAFNTGITRS